MTPYEQAIQDLEALYATLPTLHCQRQCQESCGVILMSRVEWMRIQRTLGYAPKGKRSLVCPMLDKQGLCRVQAIKPLLCRLFGLMDEPRMRCPWGCQPERWLTEEEGYALLAEAEAISQRAFPARAGLTLDLVPPHLQKEAAARERATRTKQS